MTDNCLWCGYSVSGWPYTWVLFLSKPIHPKCIKELRRKFKKEYGFVIPKSEKELLI